MFLSYVTFCQYCFFSQLDYKKIMQSAHRTCSAGAPCSCRQSLQSTETPEHFTIPFSFSTHQATLCHDANFITKFLCTCSKLKKETNKMTFLFIILVRIITLVVFSFFCAASGYLAWLHYIKNIFCREIYFEQCLEAAATLSRLGFDLRNSYNFV